jgi:site-specific recombinase XerD
MTNLIKSPLQTNNLSLAEMYIKSFPNKNTQSPYRLALKRFYEYLSREGYTSLNDVTLEVAELFRADLEMDYSPKTCNMTLSTVKDFYKWIKVRLDNSNGEKQSLGLEGYDWINLDILNLRNTRVDVREQKTETCTENEAKKLLSVAYNMPDKFQSNQYKLTLLLSLNAGLRVKELTQLKPGNFKLQGSNYVISIMGKGMRKRVVSLSVPVTNELKVIFEEINYSDNYFIIQGKDLAGNSDPTKPITAANVWKRIKKIAVMANLGKDISPHSLRRTCATILYKRGVPIESIQRIMGHDNPHTTQRYIDMEIDAEVSAKFALDITNKETA